MSDPGGNNSDMIVCLALLLCGGGLLAWLASLAGPLKFSMRRILIVMAIVAAALALIMRAVNFRAP